MTRDEIQAAAMAEAQKQIASGAPVVEMIACGYANGFLAGTIASHSILVVAKAMAESKKKDSAQ